jgi:asparagine N-glycosylation enzyme membrane subunit Stt3
MPEDTIMVLVPETIVVLNLLLCVVIRLLGYLMYRTPDIIRALFIGISSYSGYRT